jgi:hypothetical protein
MQRRPLISKGLEVYQVLTGMLPTQEWVLRLGPQGRTIKREGKGQLAGRVLLQHQVGIELPLTPAGFPLALLSCMRFRPKILPAYNKPFLIAIM